jgi:hypothetical protein
MPTDAHKRIICAGPIYGYPAPVRRSYSATARLGYE